MAYATAFSAFTLIISRLLFSDIAAVTPAPPFASPPPARLLLFFAAIAVDAYAAFALLLAMPYLHLRRFR